jgi:Fe-S cluster assembly iron-binding protein IscA
MGERIFMVKLKSGAGPAISSFLNESGVQGRIRIDLESSGCCEPTLTLSLDHLREDDLVADIEGLVFLMNQDVYRLVGDVTISYVDDHGRKGFVVTSRKPVSEWGGFCLCNIRV